MKGIRLFTNKTADEVYDEVILPLRGSRALSKETEADLKIYDEFSSLKGSSSRPVDVEPRFRTLSDVNSRLALLPPNFFDPLFCIIREIEPDLRIELSPDFESHAIWNPKPPRNLAKELAIKADSWLSTNPTSTSISEYELLVRNLESVPFPPLDWDEQGERFALIVPGARTFERPTSAFYLFKTAIFKPCIICSGLKPYWSNGSSVSEASAYSAYLRILGIPPESIVMEARASDTMENASNTLQILNELGVRRVIISSSPYHLRRVAFDLMLADFSNNHLECIFGYGCFSKYNRATLMRKSEDRRQYLTLIFNEYFKVAHDLVTEERTIIEKVSAGRSEYDL